MRLKTKLEVSASALTFALVLWFGGKQVIDRQISLGEFVAFYAFMVQLVFPMIALGFVTNIFQRGAASMGCEPRSYSRPRIRLLERASAARRRGQECFARWRPRFAA